MRSTSTADDNAAQFLPPPGFVLERDRNCCHLTEHLIQVFEQPTGTDVVIRCPDAEFSAHRSVLAASSPYFFDIFRNVPSGIVDLTIILQGYNGPLVEKLLEFIYTGQATLSKEEEGAFMELLTEWEVGDSPGSVQCLTGTSVSADSVADEEELEVQGEEEEDHTLMMVVEEEGGSPATSPMQGKSASTKRKTGSKAPVKSLECPTCGQVLKTKTGLRMHLLVHQGSKGKAFSCGVCGKAFSQASQLKTHTRIHTGERPYACDQCDKSFSHASTLSEHKNLHNAVKPFQCNVCQQSFAQKKALRAHRCQPAAPPPSQTSTDSADASSIADGNIKGFICPYCHRSFTSRRGLSIHKMHQHAETSSEPLLQCDLCAATFASEQSYEEHLATH